MSYHLGFLTSRCKAPTTRSCSSSAVISNSAPSMTIFATFDAPSPSAMVRVRRQRSRGRPPLLLPQEIQAVLDGDAQAAERLAVEHVSHFEDLVVAAL